MRYYNAWGLGGILRSQWSHNWASDNGLLLETHLPKVTLISGSWVKLNPPDGGTVNGTDARVQGQWGQEENQKHHIFLKWPKNTAVKCFEIWSFIIDFIFPFLIWKTMGKMFYIFFKNVYMHLLIGKDFICILHSALNIMKLVIYVARRVACI